MATSSIGSTGDYTTIAAWVNFLQTTDFGSGTGVLTAPQIGELQAEDFSESNDIDSLIITTAANYVHLRAQAAAEHSGVAASTTGDHARIIGPVSVATLEITTNHVRVSGIEISNAGGTANAARSGIRVATIAGAGDVRVHNCIIHNDQQNGSLANHGIDCDDSGITFAVYRNIVYGMSGSGIRFDMGASDSVIYNNTCYENVGSGIIFITDICTIKNNACFNSAAGDYIYVGGETRAKNASSDTTGDSGLTSLVATNQFINATTTWANANLLLKAGSGLINAGEALTSPYDIDITGESAVVPWDIGADELVIISSSSSSSTNVGDVETPRLIRNPIYTTDFHYQKGIFSSSWDNTDGAFILDVDWPSTRTSHITGSQAGELIYSGDTLHDLAAQDDTDNANFAIKVSFVGTDDTKLTIRGRRQDASNHVGFTLDFVANTISLVESTAGTETILTQLSHPLDGSGTIKYIAELWMFEGKLTGVINGYHIIQINSRAFITEPGLSLYVPSVDTSSPIKIMKAQMFILEEQVAPQLENDLSDLYVAFRKSMKNEIENPAERTWETFTLAHDLYTKFKDRGHLDQQWEELGYPIREPSPEEWFGDT